MLNELGPTYQGQLPGKSYSRANTTHGDEGENYKRFLGEYGSRN